MAEVTAVCISERKGTRKHEVPSIRVQCGHGIVGDAHAGNWHRQISLLAEESVDKMRALGLTLVPSCGACLSNMAVAPDGGVIPCQSWLSSQPLGNMLTDDWDKIWQSQRCAAIRAKSAKMEQLCQLRQGNGEEASVC